MSQPTTPKLGAALKQRRKALGLNLNQLAELSSVSRSMLSEIERGNANPTFTSLWNITQALGVSIDELTQLSLDDQELTLEHQSIQNTPRMLSEDGGCELRALNPIATATEFEWYELVMQPGSTLNSDAHTSGTQEHLSVISGELTVELNEQRRNTATTGETLRYSADVQHRIINSAETESRGFLVVHKAR